MFIFPVTELMTTYFSSEIQQNVSNSSDIIWKIRMQSYFILKAPIFIFDINYLKSQTVLHSLR